MTYYVTFAIDGRYTEMVDADSLEQAKAEAEIDFWNCNLNEMECISSDIVSIENGKGEYVYEK